MKERILAVLGACLLSAGLAALYIGTFGSTVSYSERFFHLAPILPESRLWKDLAMRWSTLVLPTFILVWWGIGSLAGKEAGTRKWRVRAIAVALLLVLALLALFAAGYFFGQSWTFPVLAAARSAAMAFFLTAAFLFSLIFAAWPGKHFSGQQVGPFRRLIFVAGMALAAGLSLSVVDGARIHSFPAMSFDTRSAARGSEISKGISARLQADRPQRWPAGQQVELKIYSSLSDFEREMDDFALRLDKGKTYSLRADIAATGFAVELEPDFRALRPAAELPLGTWTWKVEPKQADGRGERKMRAEIFVVDAADGKDVFPSSVYVLDIVSGRPWGLPPWLVSPFLAIPAIVAGLAAIAAGFLLQKRRDGEID